MIFITHKNYLDGPFKDKEINLLDWIDKNNWKVFPGGHFYSRRNRFTTPANDSGSSALYYLGTITNELILEDFVIPFHARNLTEDEKYQNLRNLVKQHIEECHEKRISLVSVDLLSGLTITQAFHKTSSEENIDDYLDFLRHTTFDPARNN